MADLDLLMVTHNRLNYLQRALPSVLAQDYDFNLLMWDNGSGNETVKWLLSQKDPRVSFHFNKTNDSLASVTTKVFKNFKAEYVGKVDSDIIFPSSWARRLIDKHKERHYGFLGGIHFRPEDFERFHPIIENGVWHKHHIGGNYIIRREDFGGYEGKGVMGLSEYQEEMGYPNGYLWNLWIEHMEDARSLYYIHTKEYDEYKKKTRGMTLEKYQTGIVNHNYLKENTL